MRMSKRAKALPAYAVGKIADRKRALKAQGVDVIDLGAGDADFAPPPIAVQSLASATADRAMSRYPFQQGLLGFREAASRFMLRRFGVIADPVQHILPLLGSKEGLAHLPFGVMDPGDVCVVPEPGYPAYLGGALLSGAEVLTVPLRQETGFLVELNEIPISQLRRVRLVFLNYPNNPTGAVAPRDYLERTVSICREHGIVLAYDNPYSEITFDGYVAPSIFEVDGAWDVAIEFHSVSKSFGMTGWRLAWAVGNPDLIQALSKVKSYIDTGVFLAVQRAGADVLDHAEDVIRPIRDAFGERRDALVAALAEVGFRCEAPKAGMYLWLPLPPGTDEVKFAEECLESEGLAILAGSVFGKAGEGFVRLSFITEPDRLVEAARRMGRVLNNLGAVRAPI